MSGRNCAEHAAVVGLCSYEVAAIFSRRRWPTITELDRRNHAVGTAIVVALLLHFAESRRLHQAGR